MRAQTLPAAAGWGWLMSAFALFKRNPMLLSMLVMGYWMCVLLLNIIPVLGSLAASIAIPGLSVGLMQAARHLERGEMFGLPTLFGSFRQNTKTLCLLGALYLLCTLGVVGISSVVDGGQLMQSMIDSRQGKDAPELEVADLLIPMLSIMALMTPVLMAYWFAPVLAAWHGTSVGKSLFFSFVACWLNWRAFLAYGAGLLLLAGIIPGTLMTIILLLVPGAQSFVTALVTAMMLLFVAPIVFTSFYTSYRDIFGLSEIA